MTKGEGLEIKIVDIFKVLFYFSDVFKYLTNHSLESIPVWTIGSIESLLWLEGSMLRIRLDFKI